MTSGTHEMLGIMLVNGAAIEASASDSDTPICKYVTPQEAMTERKAYVRSLERTAVIRAIATHAHNEVQLTVRLHEMCLLLRRHARK